MEEKDVQVSKFMKSMMNSDGVGWKENGKIQVDSDDEDPVWNCFSYMFKVKNLWIYAVVTFLSIFAKTALAGYSRLATSSMSNVVGISLLATLGYSLVYGYLFPFIKSLSVQQKTYTMPRFKFWQSIGQFIKFNIALALFVIPVFVIPAVIVLFTVGTNPEYQYVWVILCVIMLIALCFFCFYSFAMFWLFTNKGYWTSFVRFKDVFTLINRNRSRYLDTIGVGVLGFILTLVAIGIVSNPYFIHISGQATQTTLAINDLLPIILTSIIGTYSMFVCAYLVAKCISAKELDLNQNAESVS